MMVHFAHLLEETGSFLEKTRLRLQIAVCWFTAPSLFKILLKKLQEGVQIDLLLEHDAQNFHPGGLPFENFLSLGGHLYGFHKEILMHHKFAIADGKVVLCGSFNWTKGRNTDHVLVADDAALVERFAVEFCRLKSLALPLTHIQYDSVKGFQPFALFQTHARAETSLKMCIARGAKIWMVNFGKKNQHFSIYKTPDSFVFKDNGLLKPYWDKNLWWDSEGWAVCVSDNKNTWPVRSTTHFRLIAEKMNPGDLILAIENKNQVKGIGILQADPFYSVFPDFGIARTVEWIWEIKNQTILLDKPITGVIRRYSGSGMALLNTLTPLF